MTLPESFVLSPPPLYRRLPPHRAGDLFQHAAATTRSTGCSFRSIRVAGQILDQLEVAARFNDTDIAHVLSENLHHSGHAGRVRS